MQEAAKPAAPAKAAKADAGEAEDELSPNVSTATVSPGQPSTLPTRSKPP